jgi:hypothetical protein
VKPQEGVTGGLKLRGSDTDQVSIPGRRRKVQRLGVLGSGKAKVAIVRSVASGPKGGRLGSRRMN